MENIKEEKAREYAEVQYGDPRKYEYRSQLDKFEECLEHFKAGFEAGKQERDRVWIEKLKSKITEHWKMQDFYTQELEAIVKEFDPTYEGFC